MILDLIKSGTIVNIIIKAQHNTWSGRQSYSGNFVPIVHEYVIITNKEESVYIPVSFSVRKGYDMRFFGDQGWRDLVHSVIRDKGGRMSLQDLYDAQKDSAKA